MIWYCDCEWGYKAHRINLESALEPVVFCALNARTRERVHFWGRDDRLSNFIKQHRDDLWVSHNNLAEMKYLIRLKCYLPNRWFDTQVAWRWITNQPGFLEASLVAILEQLKIPHLPPLYKNELRDKILHLAFDPVQDRDIIIDYCLSDCDGCGEIYSRINGQIDPVAMAYWAEYLKVVSKMELRGVPVDIATARLIVNSREAIVDHLQHKVNETVLVYEDGVFKRRAFLAYLAREGIAWPWSISKITGRPTQSLNDDTMKTMGHRHPFIALVRQVRKTCNSFNRRLGVKFDEITRRHYFSSWPFRSITSRNQPKAFIFTGPKWYRWLIQAESPDHMLAYIDYHCEEICIAATLARDDTMRSMYEHNDAHLWFAIQSGVVPPHATKKTHRAIRDKFKVVNLGVLYGQSEYGISEQLGITLVEAKELLDQHRALFPTYHAWSRKVTQSAYDRGKVSTKLGWQCKVPSDSKFRTWQNWPVQAAGADLMRLTIIYFDQQGLQLLAPIHDGFLLTCRRSQQDDLRTAVNLACSQAVKQVLGADCPMRWDVTFYQDRFEDENGAPLWNLMTEALVKLYGGLPDSV